MRHDTAAGDDGHVIAEDANLFQNVAGKDDAPSRIAHFAEQQAQRADGGNIQTIGRLIQQNILRSMKNGSGQGGLHALTLGKTRGAAIGNGFQAQLSEHLAHSLSQLVGRDTAQLAEIGQVLARGEARIAAKIVTTSDSRPQRSSNALKEGGRSGTAGFRF